MRYMAVDTLGSINGLTSRSPTTLPKGKFHITSMVNSICSPVFPPPQPSPYPLHLGWVMRIIFLHHLEKLMISESTTGHYPNKRSVSFMVEVMVIFITIPSS